MFFSCFFKIQNDSCGFSTLTVFDFVFRMQTNNKTSLARFNKRREMKCGLEIGFDHMLPSEVGESTKILEVLCNVLFCLNAPRGGFFVD